jgi:hypothetical protein
MESEVVYFRSQQSEEKAKTAKTEKPGEDNIHAEVLKLMNTRKLCQLFNL